LLCDASTAVVPLVEGTAVAPLGLTPYGFGVPAGGDHVL